MKKAITLSLVILLLLSSMSISQAATVESTNKKATEKNGTIKIIISVDWEGISLDEENIQLISEFRELYPDIPLVQFLNPAFYTRDDFEDSYVTKKIKKVIGTEDEIGLHLHAWKSLIETADVEFRSEPTFERGIQQIYSEEPGFDVPITKYTKKELKSIIKESKTILAENGFSNIKSFRSGAWISNDALKEVLVEEGFTKDYSAVPCELVKDELSSTYIYALLQNSWENITPNSQPYIIDVNGKSLYEIPNNCALVDYIDGQEMVNLFKNTITEYNKNPKQDKVLVYGFHQESATDFIYEMENALDRIIDLAENANVPIEFVTSSGLNLDNSTEKKAQKEVKTSDTTKEIKEPVESKEVKSVDPLKEIKSLQEPKATKKPIESKETKTSTPSVEIKTKKETPTTNKSDSVLKILPITYQEPTSYSILNNPLRISIGDFIEQTINKIYDRDYDYNYDYDYGYDYDY